MTSENATAPSARAMPADRAAVAGPTTRTTPCAVEAAATNLPNRAADSEKAHRSFNHLLAASIVLLMLAATTAGAQEAVGYLGHARVPQLLDTLSRSHGFSSAELAQVRSALAQAQKLPQLIEQEQKAPERTETWTRYSRRVDDSRVSNGVEIIRLYPEEFARAEREYGVPAPVIAAILGIETRYGRITGNVRVLDSLATQGLDHPTRWPAQPTGSYAGAMGAAQFMPSNYRRLALDFDGDGRRDLWSLPDAIGSIAYYLTAYRPERAWQRGQPLITRARVGAPVPEALPRNGKQPIAYLHQLAQLDIRPESRLPDSAFVGLIELPLDDGSQEYWLGLPNFYAVMTYNPRTFYAMAVAQLAERIAAQLALSVEAAP
jgi:membrane-bound lytic murein transglycosylase B